MSDLLKKADIPEYSDDAWREILHANGFVPSGTREEVWRSPQSDVQIRIDVDREKGEPYYQIVTEDGTASAKWTDSEALKSIVEPRGVRDADEPPALSPEDERKFDEGFMRDMKIVGRQHSAKEELLRDGAKAWSLIIGDEYGKQEFARFYVDSQDEGVRKLKGLANVPLRPDQERDLRENGVIVFGNRLVRLRDEDYPQRRLNVYAGRLPQFSFTVPTKAAATVAFHLAKAGMKDFDVEHYEDDEVSMFTFTSEPEMHVAEEIVKAEYADQIRSRKGLWSTWSEPGRSPFESFQRGVEPSKYVASVGMRHRGNKVAGQWGDRSYDSDQVHDILDKHRPQDPRGAGFDEPIPAAQLPAILKELDGMAGGDDPDRYLGIVVFLVTHGSDVPGVVRERARQIAFALVQDEGYIGEWKNPELRKVELENEIELLEGPPAPAENRPEITDDDLPEGFFSDKTFEEQARERGETSWKPHRNFPSIRPVASKTALQLPNDLQYLNLPPSPAPRMSESEERRMLAYRRRKLVAWLREMGFLDAQGNGEMLAEYDAATDFHEKDRLYEEARDMVRDERKSQNAYRRKMRG